MTKIVTFTGGNSPEFSYEQKEQDTLGEIYLCYSDTKSNQRTIFKVNGVAGFIEFCTERCPSIAKSLPSKSNYIQKIVTSIRSRLNTSKPYRTFLVASDAETLLKLAQLRVHNRKPRGSRANRPYLVSFEGSTKTSLVTGQELDAAVSFLTCGQKQVDFPNIAQKEHFERIQGLKFKRKGDVGFESEVTCRSVVSRRPEFTVHIKDQTIVGNQATSILGGTYAKIDPYSKTWCEGRNLDILVTYVGPLPVPTHPRQTTVNEFISHLKQAHNLKRCPASIDRIFPLTFDWIRTQVEMAVAFKSVILGRYVVSPLNDNTTPEQLSADICIGLDLALGQLTSTSGDMLVEKIKRQSESNPCLFLCNRIVIPEWTLFL